MPDTQFKRNTAYKMRISDILGGKPVTENEKFAFLEFENKKVFRVNVIASIVDKYDVNGERKYVFLTIDDGSGQIKAKSFGDDSEKLRNMNLGQTVAIIGTIRYYNNEIYISPETIKEHDPRYLIVRKLEIEKQKPKPPQIKSHEIKDRIIDLIKNSEKEGGIDTSALNSKLNEFSPSAIDAEIKKLLEEGMVFEPRPGKIRWLG